MSSVDALRNHSQNIKDAYEKHRLRKRLFIIALIPVVIVLIGLAVAFGSADISFADVYKTLFRKLIPGLANAANAGNSEIIIWKLRLPRIIMGVLAGIALGSAGATMQVVLKNPLADPYMLGISSAAGFGASLAIILGVGVLGGSYLIIGNAFIFSVLSSGLILAISGRRGASPESMVLTGLALLFFFQAMTTIIQYFGDSEAVKAAVFWTVGDLGKADWNKISITAPIVFVGEILLIWKSGDLNIMNTGDASAKSLGINVQGTRIFTMVVCTIMVAGIVSFTGTIGFIGLVAPHLVRMIIGNDNRILVPAAGLVGAVLLVLADTIARTIMSPVILPVGAVTAFLGVPLFIYLIMKKNGGLS
ncbi:MAG: iron ABC transporter permease [Spirochaetales bacterium]|nr:iron ABC transporter permease [Spirochaetales bacterium]